MIIYKQSGEVWRDVDVLDSSYQEESIQGGERKIRLEFVLPESTDVPQLSYVEWLGARYTLYSTPQVTKVSIREYRYAVIFDGEEAKLKDILCKFTTSGNKTKFVMTATPQQFADMLTLNVQGWTAGECIEAEPKTVSFSEDSVLSASERIAKEFETEVDFTGNKFAFRKRQLFVDDPLVLSYRNGLQSNVRVSPDGDETPIGRLYVQGGERNIDRVKYGSSTLRLPKNASMVYGGHTYKTDETGQYIYIDGDARQHTAERAFDATQVYPSRVGVVSSVELKPKTDKDGTQYNDYDIIDTGNTVDYSQYRVDGEVMTVIFRTGRLAGKSFAIATKDDALVGYNHTERRFMLLRQEHDGVMMPEPTTYYPEVGDKYAVFGCSLPQEYIGQAEQEIFRRGVEYMSERLEYRRLFSGDLDGIWAKRNWSSVGHKLVLGATVRLTDPELGATQDVRISGIRREINSRYTPRLTFSNAPFLAGTASSRIASLEAREVRVEETERLIHKLSQRTYNSVIDIRALIDALELKQFTESISPKTISTIQGIFGMPECQFKFVKTKTDTTEVSFVFSFRRGGTELYIPSQYIAKEKQSDTLTSSKEWVVHHVPELTYSLKDDETSLYLYAQLSSGGNKFVLTKEPLPLTAENNLVGLVTGLAPSRQLTTMYGVTEITPGQVMTKMIRSASGNVYWDLVTGDLVIGDPKGNTCLAWIGGKLYIKGIMVTVGGKETTIERALQDQSDKVDDINVGTRNLLLKSGEVVSNSKYKIHTYELSEVARELKTGDPVVLAMKCRLGEGKERFIPYNSGGSVGIWSLEVKRKDIGADGVAMIGGTWRTDAAYGEQNRTLEFYALRDGVTVESTIEWVKLVRGNRASRDWEEAPEDIEERYQKLISAVDVEFALGDSMTVAPSSGWQTTAPAPQTGKYLWQRTKTTLKDGNVTYKGVTCIQGKHGTNGAKGRGLTSVTEQYYHSTSMTALTGGSWGSSAPIPAPGKWIWTRSVIAYDDNTSTTTSPICVTGDKGDKGAPGKDAINYSAGLLLYGDPTFTEGVNWTHKYNNAGGNTTTWERIIKPADCPSSSTHAMSYKYLGGGSTQPGLGGFTYHTTSRANAVFVYRIIAKIPVGYKISYATNPYGDGGTQQWLTEQLGTSKYEEYVILIKCGSTGSFSSIGYFYFDKSSVNTPNAPFEVIVSYATAFDMTSAPNYYQHLYREQRAREAAEKAFAEANKKALDAAQRAYEKALSAAKYHGQYGEYSSTIKYPYTERETSVVIYKGVPYVLTGEHTAGVAPDSTAGKKIWQAISSMEALYARKVLADYAQIGDMMLYNGEGSDDFIAFERKDDNGEIHRYMQIGGRAKTENEMLDQSTSDVIPYSVRPLYTSTSGIHVVDRYDSKEGNRLVKYTADVAVAAVAECEWELIDGQGFYQSRSSSVEAKLKIVVKARSGGVKYERESDPVTTTATTPTMHESYFDPDKAIVRTFKVAKITLSVEAARINRYDQVELQLVLNGTGERYTASMTDVFNYMPQDKGKSIMTVARDKISFFFGRSKYILFNYLNHYLIKIVGNVMLQGDLHVTGDLNADFIETSGAVLAGGEVNANGGVSSSFGRFKNHYQKGTTYVEKLGSGQACYTRVWHSIGSDKYVPFVTPTNVPWSDQASIVNKQANYFDVRFYNGSGQSYHYPFNYICYRAD